MDLDIHQYLSKAKERQDCGALQSAFSLIQDITAAGVSGRDLRIAPELYVVCAEAALQLGCLEISTACLKMYFEGNPVANQFLCRAYLCQGQMKSPPATGSVEEFEVAVTCFLKAIEISKHDPRCSFMVFNASVLYFQTVRPLLQPGRGLHLVSSLRQVVQSLEEVADEDHSWRAELMMLLITCLWDSGKMEDAASFAKVTEEFIKSHTPQLYPRLFTLQVQHKLSESDLLTKISKQCTSMEVIYKIQEFKNGLEKMNEGELKKEDSAKLEEIFHLLVDCTKVSTTPVNSSPLLSPVLVHPTDRIAFLLELALLALQVKHQKIAADCLKELKTVGETSVGQCILMECINCGINLLKKEAKMNDYCKSSVEARLKEIRKLDKWVQTAVRERDPQAVQAVCSLQWNFCLPLLQHNLRKYIKAPLLRVVQVLEDTQSMLLGMRSQIHSELAAIEEEDGHLEASLTHLQKAMLLDNGTQRQRLSSAFHLLQLRGTLYQTPSRNEDKAAILLQQARDMQPQDKTDSHPILVAVGLLLAPDDFQMVLDADNTSKSSPASGQVAQLCAKAQHHATCVQTVDGYLARPGDEADHAERMRLWARLAKISRKQEIWDVCRAACRFCLLYDDGRWEMSKNDKCRCSGEENCAECLHSCTENHTYVRDVLHLLAEICFISAEATVQKLLTEGVKLNSPAIPPHERGVWVPEDDQHWVIYRDWIQALSAHATSNFLRAAEIGVHIKETWVVANAAIYLWNYNSHLLAAGKYQHLVPTFRRLVEMLQKMEFTWNPDLVVLLCDAVARGLIQPLCGADKTVPTPQGDKSENRSEKGTEKAANVHGTFLDPDALQDVHKALELCDYALYISSCHNPRQTVPIAARKQVVATWVQVKRLLQQQIGLKTDIKEENEDVSAMMRVLVGVEMLQCNKNLRHKEFSVPSLSTLVSMASEFSWTEAVVELQVWCQLAAFCHNVNDHSLVLCCTENALRLEEAAAKSLNTIPYALYGLTAVNEMLSSAACLRGLGLAHESSGNLRTYREALKMLLFGVSYAEKADNPALCITAAKHYWNTCVPLTQIPGERWLLQKPLEKIVTALVHTSSTHTNKQGKAKYLLTLAAMPPGSSKDEAKDEEDLNLIADIYSFLLKLHVDKADWKGALQLLDKAINDMPCTRLPLQKQRILVKVRLGESILMDMQTLQDEDEQCCSFMWHRAALCAGSKTQQLTYYQKSITSALCAKTQWQKISLLIEFGVWLYCHNFPKADAHHQVQWAIDILLHVEPEQAEGAEDEPKKRDLSLRKCEPLVGVQALSWTQNVSNLKEVWRLDYLIQAHTVIAVMTDKASPEHQLNLFRAYNFVLQIWKVSMAVASEISNDMGKHQTPRPPQSAGSKKDQDKGKSKKMKEHTPAEERPKSTVLDNALPSTLMEWACYMCPDQARQIFRTTSNPHCISKDSIMKQTQCLFYLDLLENELHLLSLDHLTLPVLHLAETIAHDLLDSRSLSDLYQLRILRTCCQLGLEAHSPFQEKHLNRTSIQEEEQMRCYKELILSQERRGLHKAYNQKTGIDEISGSWQEGLEMRVQDIWLDKAEVCLSMGLYQTARQLLAEVHLISVDLGDIKSLARCWLKLAMLACEEQNHSQALILLDKAQALGGDKEFWYHFTLTKVRAIFRQRHQDAQTKAVQIIKQGCEALEVNPEQWAIHIPELTFMIISLKRRGAIECTCAISASECGEVLCTEAVQRLTAACDTLRECATGFTKLNYRDLAAETHVEYAHALRILSTHTSDPDSKQCFLLSGLSQMQLAVTLQEHVVLNAQNLLRPQEEIHGLSLAAMRRLLRLRLALAEFCLLMLEEHCAEEKSQAVARMWKTSVKIAVEDFTRCTPEPNSLEEEWVSVGHTLGQVTLSQLVAVKSHSLVNKETRARCLSLLGKYLRLQAVHEDPIYMCSLWSRNKQKEACSDPKDISIKEQSSEKDKYRESSIKEPRMTSAKCAELKQRTHKAQQLLAQASRALAEAISLCLQHNLPCSILTDASLEMLECHGQSDPAAAGQYLALFQSCCTVSLIAEVLSSAYADTSVSQFSALLSLHRKLLLSQEERSNSTLRQVEDSLNNLSKAFSHLIICPNHLNILAELPPNLKILLLQHSEDGSELYGAFYETTKDSEVQKGKTGILACARVAKVSVCPQALLALRQQTRAFGQETRHALLKEGCWHGADGRLEVPKGHQETAAKEKLQHHFRNIVQDMEDYLTPLLNQFDFSCLRLKTLSVPEMTRTKEKEEKANSAKEELGTYVVLLADRKLLELPLESLSILQEEGLTSVSRDFSFQLLHSRLNKEEPEKVERDNKKELKGGRGTKGKGDQSGAIKVIPANRVLPSNTFPVDLRNFKYIIEPYHECSIDTEGTSLFTRIEEILESHSQHFTHPPEGFVGNKHKLSVSELEQLLCRCSAFIYLGMARFTENVPAAKLAGLNMHECRMALLFDQVQNADSLFHQSNLHMQKSAGQFALQEPLETALLLSVGGVSCVVLNQWHSSLQQNILSVATVLDNLLSSSQSSGQAIHALRKRTTSVTPQDNRSYDQELLTDSEEDDVHLKMTHLAFNCVLYGLPNLIVT